MGIIQKIYSLHFKSYKIRFTSLQVKYIITDIKQEEEILKEHNRAHRGITENKAQLSEKCYVPKMKEKITYLIN